MHSIFYLFTFSRLFWNSFILIQRELLFYSYLVHYLDIPQLNKSSILIDITNDAAVNNFLLRSFCLYISISIR